MTVLVVGGDRLGLIPKKLEGEGVTEIIHWRGRQKGKARFTRPVPKRVGKIIVFCDFVKHDLARHVKKEAKCKGIPIAFCRRSASWMQCCPSSSCADVTASASSQSLLEEDR